MFFYDYYTLVILLPLMVLSFIVQAVLNSSYSKYSKIQNSKRTTGCEIAHTILRNAGIFDVSVECIGGNLSDHFDPTKKVIRLSEKVYNGTSIAAIGVAAHETGHALQYAAEYTPIKIRSSIIGITNFSSKILYILIILSFIAQIPLICNIAVICFFIIFLFQLLTLPVEFNASARAVENIGNMGYNDDDLHGVKKVLTDAAMTYVMAMLVALGQMITFILRTRKRD